MPVTVTYPGVYIEEIPSGVRTITGVATSITAFIGRAMRGPLDQALVINSYADYERIFGGLWLDSSMSYAVRDFYRNGGAQAVIVRLYQEETGQDALPAKSSITLSDNGVGLVLETVSPGAWGNRLRARVDHEVSSEVAADMGLAETDLFNLAIHDSQTGSTELFRNVTVVASPRQVDTVLENRSQLMRVLQLSNGRPKAHPAPQEGEDVWGDNPTPTNTKVAAEDEASDGEMLTVANFIGTGMQAAKKGLYALEQADLFNLLCIPPYTSSSNVDSSLVSEAAAYCEKRRAMMIVDSPSNWMDKEGAKNGISTIGTTSKNAAIFFPRLRQPNPLKDNQMEAFVPCGAVAGVFARTDAQRGVWKAPAGLDATLVGVPDLTVVLTDPENGELNPLGINCLRSIPPSGRIIWGSRTMKGDDRLASEWKYVPVRRLALFIEESLYRGTQWVVFEPNDEPLWSQIRLNVGAFMHNLFRQGAFQGSAPKDAYFVKCDKETTTQNDINLGIVNVLVGFAPLKPAEFVVIKIQQMAGEIES
jgi:phage tail sheath protein FI